MMKNRVPLLTIFVKQHIVILLFLLSLSGTMAQVKVGENPQNINSSSLLELESTDKVMVLSRITTAQMQAITPLQGAVIYNIEEECVFYYNGSNWINLCRDGNGFSIVDNGDNTYTVNDGINPEFTFSTNTETITRITQNPDGTYTYTNEAGEETLIATTTTGTSNFSITDNGDNTYTFNDGTIPAFTLSANPETITKIVQNPNGTFTYTDEAGEETVIANGSGTGTGSLTIIDNGNDTYTVNDGTNPEFIITAKPETITSIIENEDGSFTYTNEADEEVTIATNNLSIVDNGNDTYTVNDGTNPEFIITAKPETITSITENGNGTYTYTNEADEEVIISFSGTSEEGSVFFADDMNGLAENNTQLFWDNTNARLGLGTNTNLTDKLTVNGSIGIADGTVLDPSYRFSVDSDTGIYRVTDNELGFTTGGISKMKLTEGGLNLNNALPLDPVLTDKPLMIRANEGELIGLQRSDGELKWNINLFEKNLAVGIQGGLNFVEAGVETRFFIENARNLTGPDYGRIGINTRAPQSTLHVVGNMRVTDLQPSQSGDSFVTVDNAGVFRKATSAQAAVTGGGRWTNSTTPLGLNGGVAILPLFDVVDYNDGAGEFYEANSNELVIKKDGRYDIRATISLIGNVRANGAAASTWARISINGFDVGALSVAGNNGSTDPNAYSSINLNDILNLQANDVLRIKMFSDANPTGIRFINNSTSNFTIIRL